MKTGSKELSAAIKAIDKQQAEWDKKYHNVFASLRTERNMQKRRLLQAQLNDLALELKQIKEQYLEILKF
jgi:hypothetical protein